MQKQWGMHIPHEKLFYFMSGYFNDIAGTVSFLAFCNLLLEANGQYMKKWTTMAVIMLVCGCYFEYVVPLFRVDTISDVWDLLAYQAGAFIYWAINQAAVLGNKQKY